MAAIVGYASDLFQKIAENKLFVGLMALYFAFKFYNKREAARIANAPVEGSKVKKIKRTDDWDKLMEESVATGGVIVVDFFATWCPPCLAATPVYAKLSAEYCQDSNKCQFWKVDVDQINELAKRQGVESMPTFQFYKAGVKVDQMVGFGEARFVSMLQKYLV